MGRIHLVDQHNPLVHRDLADRVALAHPSIQESQAYTCPLDLQDLNINFSLGTLNEFHPHQVRQCSQEHQQHFYHEDRVRQVHPLDQADQHQCHHQTFLVDLEGQADHLLLEVLVHLLVRVYRVLVVVS